MKKFFHSVVAFIFITVFFANVSVTYAESKEIAAEGEYRLGDTDTRDKAKKLALADAKRKIVEQAGVFVESYTEVNNFQVTQDQIKTAASSTIKIKSEQVNFYENGTLCKAFVVALIDTDNIGKILKKLPVQNDSVKTKNYSEFDGHYYKIFNEGMTWQEAKRYCENISGHLVTITSEREQNFIYDLLMMNGVRNSYWIGGFKGSNGEWRWITNEKFSYNNWGWNQPDGDGTALMIYFSTSNGWKMGDWNDLNSTGNNGQTFFGVNNFGFICEWESEKNIK